MGPIFPTYLGHLHDERLSNRWFRCFSVIRLTNPPYIIIMWKISSTGYMKTKKLISSVHVLIFHLSFSVWSCNQVPCTPSWLVPLLTLHLLFDWFLSSFLFPFPFVQLLMSILTPPQSRGNGVYVVARVGFDWSAGLIGFWCRWSGVTGTAGDQHVSHVNPPPSYPLHTPPSHLIPPPPPI